MLSVNSSALIQLDPEWFWVGGAAHEQHVVVFGFFTCLKVKELLTKISFMSQRLVSLNLPSEWVFSYFQHRIWSSIWLQMTCTANALISASPSRWFMLTDASLSHSCTSIAFIMASDTVDGGFGTGQHAGWPISAPLRPAVFVIAGRDIWSVPN